jgi:molybdate transport system substrate-binding protein
LIAALIAAAATTAAAEPPTVAVAASVRPVAPALGEAFRARTGQQVEFAYASTGKLMRQILRGAPFAVLLAADSRYPQRLIEANRTLGDGKVYAFGRLGLLVPQGSPVEPDSELTGLVEALDEGAIDRLAIAHPEHAPYGRRTRAALQQAGLWDTLEPALVRGDNAAQAAQLGTTDDGHAAIVPASLAAEPEGTATFEPLDDAWYEPLAHRAVLMEGAGAIARQFYRYLSTAEARELFQAHGFELPEDARR